MLAPAPLRKVSWHGGAGEIWTLIAKFRLEPRPDPAALVPYIDRYGQSVHARWTGKIARDEDLKESAALEEQRLRAWGVPANDTRLGAAGAASIVPASATAVGGSSLPTAIRASISG